MHGLDSFRQSYGLVLITIAFLVAGTDAVGAGQGVCNCDAKACDVQASGQCSKQQRCQWLLPPLRHPWMADLSVGSRTSV